MADVIKFPDRPVYPTKEAVFDDSELVERKDGETWFNPITGGRYRWSAEAKEWALQDFPYGHNPLDF